MESLQSTVDRSNAHYPVGTLVRCRKGAGGKHEPSSLTRTVTRASVLFRHTPMVGIEGEAGLNCPDLRCPYSTALMNGAAWGQSGSDHNRPGATSVWRGYQRFTILSDKRDAPFPGP